MLKRTIGDHKFAMALGATIGAARRKRGLNQSQLALRMGRARSFVSRVERADIGCGMFSLRRFAFALGTTSWELLRSAELRLDRTLPIGPMVAPAIRTEDVEKVA